MGSLHSSRELWVWGSPASGNIIVHIGKYMYMRAQANFKMPTLPTFLVRFDEQQLVDLATKARVQGTKRGYLHKSDSKLKKLSQRWCCVFSNYLFYFEREPCTRPLGVVFLEGCTCIAVDQIIDTIYLRI